MHDRHFAYATAMSTRFLTSYRIIVLIIAVALGAASPAASAQKFQPGSVYICPNTPDTGLSCYLDAVRHLYTMCRHIKSIEVIEHGYEKSQEGSNGAKSDYCVDKQKINITRPYQAALLEATGSKDAVNGLRTLQQLWLEALIGLKWQPGETDEAYKERVARPYAAFGEWGDSIRKSVDAAPKVPPAAKAAVHAPAPAPATAKPKKAAPN
jgi:hypothetical protein